MARSLKIKREEHARTSPLFTGFLLLSALLLGLSGMAHAQPTIDPGPSVHPIPALP